MLPKVASSLVRELIFVSVSSCTSSKGCQNSPFSGFLATDSNPEP